jgi:hypothetical protein
VKRAALVVLVALLLFGTGTWLALESQEVVVLRTRSADGSTRETRIWVADSQGLPWIEAATPERSWYRELVAHPRVELVRSGTTRPFMAEPVEGSEGHEKIRALLRDRYGFADWWVGLLQDTSRSVAVRLRPVEAP